MACGCPPEERLECDAAWFDWGWNCPYYWRPGELDVRVGDRITLRPKARMWTGLEGDPDSELYRSNAGGDGHEYVVQNVLRRRDKTFVAVLDSFAGVQVYVCIWGRYNREGRGTGVKWADLA